MSGKKSNRPPPKGMPAQAGQPSKAQPTSGTQPAPVQPAQVDITDAAIAAIQPTRARLEEIRSHPVMSYFLDEGSHLADDQMEVLFEHLRRLGKQEQISLWLYSRGGATVVPVKVVSLLREFASKISVLVPYRAHSAATHIAMGADEIVMSEMSELGPVDPSRGHPLLPTADGPHGKQPLMISVQDLRHVLGFLEREIGKDDLTPDAAAVIYSALFDKVHPLAIGALEQSWALSDQVSRFALSTHMDPTDSDGIDRIADRLGEYYKEHTYPISRAEAREIGLKVTDATTEEAGVMWELYQAYRAFGVNGAGEINGETALARRLLHIDSAGAASVFVGLQSTADPSTQAVQVFSKWLSDPV